MKIRNAILAVCASALALGLTATAGICGGFEKTFLGGDASVGRANSRKSAGGVNSNLAWLRIAHSGRLSWRPLSFVIEINLVSSLRRFGPFCTMVITDPPPYGG
jgi:hypothetical protein